MWKTTDDGDRVEMNARADWRWTDTTIGPDGPDVPPVPDFDVREGPRGPQVRPRVQYRLLVRGWSPEYSDAIDPDDPQHVREARLRARRAPRVTTLPLAREEAGHLARLSGTPVLVIALRPRTDPEIAAVVDPNA